MADASDDSLNDPDSQPTEFDPWADLEGVLESVEETGGLSFEIERIGAERSGNLSAESDERTGEEPSGQEPIQGERGRQLEAAELSEPDEGDVLEFLLPTDATGEASPATVPETSEGSGDGSVDPWLPAGGFGSEIDEPGDLTVFDAGDGFGFEDLVGGDPSGEHGFGAGVAEEPIPDGSDHPAAPTDDAALSVEPAAGNAEIFPERETLGEAGLFADAPGGEAMFFEGESVAADSEASGLDVFGESDALGASDAFGGFAPASFEAGEASGVAAVAAASVGIGALASGGGGMAVADEQPKGRPGRPRKKSGGLGAFVGVVLGGVLSIPIVIGILWALGRLPDFSGVGSGSSGRAARTVAGTSPSVQNRSLDSLAATGSESVPADAAGTAADSPAPGEPQPPMIPGATVETVAEGPPVPEGLDEKVPVMPVPASADRPADAKSSPAAAEMKDAPTVPPVPDDADGPDGRPVPPAVNAAESIGLDSSVLSAVVPAMPKEGGSPPAEAAADPGKADPFGDPSAAGPSDAARSDEPMQRIVAEPEPLDTLAVDEAADAAMGAFDALGGVAADDPGRKALLRDWYIALARVGEEAARLEGVAIERGSSLGRSLEGAERAVAAMVADDAARDDMIRVAAIWMRANARPSDGIVLPAVMPEEAASRSVGPWWITKLRPSDAPDAAELTVIARERPTAAAGEPIVVMGVILDGGVIWATQCRSPVAEPESESAAAADPDAAPAGAPGTRPKDAAADDPFAE